MYEYEGLAVEELTEDTAEEYAALELASECHVRITGLTGANALEYVSLTSEQSARHLALGSARNHWPEDITPSSYVENIFEEANILARRAGYADASAMGDALRRNQERINDLIEAEIAAWGKGEVHEEATIHRSTQPNKIIITAKGDYRDIDGELHAGTRGARWEASYTHYQEGASYEEAYCKVIIAQLRLARAFELTNDDWWGKDTAITDTAIAIWQNRLERLQSRDGEALMNYRIKRVQVAKWLEADHPELAYEIRSRVWEEGHWTPAKILFWFCASSWVPEVSAEVVILFMDHCRND